jgi:hypothetical protein
MYIMTDSAGEFFYNHSIDTSSDNDTDVLMVVVILNHDHNEKQLLRYKVLLKGYAGKLDRKREVYLVQLYNDYKR